MRFLYFLLLPLILLADFSEESIAREIKYASNVGNIDKRVLYTIAKIESGFTPLIIAFIDSYSGWEFDGITKKVTRYNDKYAIRLYGDKKNLENALKILIENNKRVDVGLMQINSVNFKKSEIDKIFSLSYNLRKAVEILSACSKLKGNLKNSIECYNRGVGKKDQDYKSYKYYEKFQKSYLKDFANIRLTNAN